MSDFKVGDRLRFVGKDAVFSARKGKLSTMVGEEYSQPWGGPYIKVRFDGEGHDGGWFPARFERIFKVGDRVKVVHDDADFEGNHIGDIGTVVLYDGADEGFWPWRVEFADGEDEIYNAKDLELAPAAEPAVHSLDKYLIRDLDEEYTEGYLVVDEYNDVAGAFDTYQEAYAMAVGLARKNNPEFTSYYVYRMITGFEPQDNAVVDVEG